MESEIRQLPIDIIKITGHNNREVFEERTLLTLGNSMSANTMLHPILVNQVGEDYKLIAGERRLRAAKADGLTTIECRVFNNLSDLQATKIMLAENRDRVPLNVIERAKGMKKLAELGVSVLEIAQAEHITTQTAQNYLDLLNLDDEILDMVVREHNPLPMYQALMLLKAPKEERKNLADRAAPLYGSVATKEELTEWIEELKVPKFEFESKEDDKPEEPNHQRIPRKVEKSVSEKTVEESVSSGSEAKKVSCNLAITGQLIMDDDVAVLESAVLTYRVGKDIESVAKQCYELDLTDEEKKVLRKIYKKASA
jgi:ParB family transcriptional regulator, chromosome partitioning protein